MVILNCMNNYFIDGGSDTCSFENKKILERQGHVFVPFSTIHKQNYPTEYSRFFVTRNEYDQSLQSHNLLHYLRVFPRILYSLEARKNVSAILDQVEPDIVHIHNIYNQLSTSIFEPIKRRGLPVIMTVHDYRLICSNHLLWIDGCICESCAGRRHYNAAMKKCVRNSRWGSILLMLESYYWEFFNRFKHNVSVFIAPSRFMKDKLVAYGFDESKVVHLPHLVSFEKSAKPNYKVGDFVLYFGRLARSKGLLTLLKAWKELNTNVELKILGSGPQRSELEGFCKQNALRNVSFLGYKEKPELVEILSNAKFVVYPSEWYENAPFVIYESYERGKPIVLSDLGGAKEMIDDAETGYIFKAFDVQDLRDKMQFMLEKSSGELIDMGKAAREKLETCYNPDEIFEKLMNIYQTVI